MSMLFACFKKERFCFPSIEISSSSPTTKHTRLGYAKLSHSTTMIGAHVMDMWKQAWIIPNKEALSSVAVTLDMK